MPTSAVTLSGLACPSPGSLVHWQELQPSKRVTIVSLLGPFPALDFCTLKGILYSSLTWPVPSLGTYQWMLWQRPDGLYLFWLLHMPADVVAWPSRALSQTQLTCWLTGIVALLSLVHTKSQLSHSWAGTMAQQGSPLNSSSRLAPGLGLVCIRGSCGPVWPQHSLVGAAAWLYLAALSPSLCSQALQPSPAWPAISPGPNMN